MFARQSKFVEGLHHHHKGITWFSKSVGKKVRRSKLKSFSRPQLSVLSKPFLLAAPWRSIFHASGTTPQPTIQCRCAKDIPLLFSICWKFMILNIQIVHILTQFLRLRPFPGRLSTALIVIMVQCCWILIPNKHFYENLTVICLNIALAKLYSLWLHNSYNDSDIVKFKIK